MEKWTLPITADIGGRQYKINSDYRDILEIISYLNNESDQQTACLIALNLFYDGFEEMPEGDYQQALEYLFKFMNCGSPESDGNERKLLDWDQDYPMIAAEVNKVAGQEVRSVPYMHWFTFIGHFHSIGEGQLSFVASIRKKKAKGKKLEKWEQEFYRENRAMVDFKIKYSPEEQKEINRLKALLGE
ncbi:MAG TPA: hypothetical protein DEP23_09835 [Ruminococcaceae bacterium]|nr:hypothetical protein [Oscillospiraceae bacterium]